MNIVKVFEHLIQSKAIIRKYISKGIIRVDGLVINKHTELLPGRYMVWVLNKEYYITIDSKDICKW